MQYSTQFQFNSANYNELLFRMEISNVKRIPFGCKCSISPNGKRIIVYSESVMSVLANDFTVYKEITFKVGPGYTVSRVTNRL